MDAVLQKAESRRAELKKELADLEAFIRLYIKFLPDASSAPEDQKKGTSKKELVETTARAILQESQPLNTSELLGKFHERGVHIGGVNEEVNLASYLSKSKQFINRRKGGGWFLSTDMEKAPQAGLEGLSN